MYKKTACGFLVGVLLLAGLNPAGAWAAIPPTQGRDVVSGGQISLKPETGPLVMVFVSARCPCSASHEPVLAALYKEFSSRGFRFVGVHSNANESPEETKAHFEKAKLPFPVIQDPELRLADQFGALKTPHAFIVSASGEVLFQGGVDSSSIAERAERHYLKDALLAIAAGKAPQVKEARALGCIIQRN